MDCEMPVCDGFTATRALRAMGCKTTIIALTASATNENRQTCFQAGMDLYQTKPISVDSLISLFADLPPFASNSEHDDELDDHEHDKIYLV